MQHILEFSQIQHFKETGYLELEAIVSEKDLKQLEFLESVDSFLSAHDLRLRYPILEKILTSHLLRTVIAHLTDEKKFRLLFDQLIFYPIDPNYPASFCLEDLSFQGALIGMLIHLTGQPSNPDLLLPKKPGSGLFFQPKHLLDLSDFAHVQSGRYLMVGYGLPHTLYRFSEKDPHTHLLKKQGYGFGDFLKNPIHPLLFEK